MQENLFAFCIALDGNFHKEIKYDLKQKKIDYTYVATQG